MQTSDPAALIKKDVSALRVVPNLVDYDAARANFDWARARGALDGFPRGGCNIAYEAVDRHADGAFADRTAFVYVRADGSTQTTTYAVLAREEHRFANVLQSLGVGRGDRVFTLLGRVPELHNVVLGTLAYGAVACPLFSAFGPAPIAQRVSLGDARVLVTTAALYERKVAGMRDHLPTLRHVLVTDDDAPAGTTSLAALTAVAADQFEIAATSAEDLALLHFTSGTTGTPKGAMHVHGAVLAHLVTARYALDLHDDDVFWCTADPGWVTGMSYGVIAPLAAGLTSVVDEAEFDARRWYEILARERVSVWYTAPTAIRRMMRAGDLGAEAPDLSALRFIASVGEPLNPEAVRWGLDMFGLPIHDNWWQTETGGIMIANYAACDIKPGSMGRPLPGIEATVIARDAEGEPRLDEHGGPVIVDEPGVEGELALRRGWPSMFRGYLHAEERYAKCFVGDWYRTGDVVSRDADGWYWFVGRADDVIKSAGHLIGPFEVESALMDHPAVAEAGVIGIPDEIAGAVVVAFVVLRPGYEPTEELRRELYGFGRRRLGPAVAPKQIKYRENLPKTRSGKIMRRLLRAQELGLPEGDLSTLEEDP